MTGGRHIRDRRVVIHSDAEVRGIREASRVTADVLDALCDAVRPGMTTLELDRLAGELIDQTGGRSAFKGYHGFPGLICISVNDEVVHGIGRPDRLIAPGDVVSLDVGVTVNGFIGDTARTVCAGEPSDTVRNLLEGTRKALAAGIAAATCGRYINDISAAVEGVARDHGLSVVRDFVGHGCGCSLHEPPEVPNFAQASRGPKLQPGMVLAIEPMLNTGGFSVEVDRTDKWTVRSADGGLSAHFEHMILITRGKPEILTWPKSVSASKEP